MYDGSIESIGLMVGGIFTSLMFIAKKLSKKMPEINIKQRIDYETTRANETHEDIFEELDKLDSKIEKLSDIIMDLSNEISFISGKLSKD